MKTILGMAKTIGQELEKEFRQISLESRPNRILFDHIPKCAGSSLSSYLKAHYPKRRVFSIIGANAGESLENFKSLPQDKRYEFNLVMGHYAHSLIDYARSDCIKITVLREPVDRIVSHYYFAKRMPNHYLHSKIVGSRISLEEYTAANLSGELCNWYTTHFSGLTLVEAERNPEESIVKAVDACKKYDLVGFVDRFASFVQELRKLANLRRDYRFAKLNVTENRPSVKEVPLSARKKIEEANHLDMEFYKRIRMEIA